MRSDPDLQKYSHLLPAAPEMPQGQPAGVILTKGERMLPPRQGRIIVFDTETTGFGRQDCIVEIGAIEVIDGEVTGHQFHSYIDAKRRSSIMALNVHQLTPEFLRENGRKMGKVMPSFLRFMGDSKLLAHNALFDMRMVNQELERLGRTAIETTRCYDSQRYYRAKFPHRRYNLDSCCQHLGISLKQRQVHGATIDAYLTARLLQKLWDHKAGIKARAGTNAMFRKRLPNR